MINGPEFSASTRKKAIDRFEQEEFDLLIIGGGITGAGAAWDAASRGLKVALVEQRDFAWGTSSRSSKLAHGGLRYLEKLEFSLVFEALSERTHLLRTAPHLVRPIPFYWPIYEGDPRGMGILNLGLGLYDFLSLFRTPGFHRRLTRRKLKKLFPLLRTTGLKGGFRYYDATMWDDVLVVETLRAATNLGAAVANYVQAEAPIERNGQIKGFTVRDLETDREIKLRAEKVVLCGGPWTDELGGKVAQSWKKRLSPSKGVHLVFDSKRFRVPGAMVMTEPADGRIAFVIDRPDFGSGVTIVGTTDSSTDPDPAKAEVTQDDVDYLLKLLNQYYPEAQLKASDILGAYVGVRPLVAPEEEGSGDAASLQKVSREHEIWEGKGGTVFVAGGKYTTYRKMGEEIVDFALKTWKGEAPEAGPSATDDGVNLLATKGETKLARKSFEMGEDRIPEELWERYGAEATDVFNLDRNVRAELPSDWQDPEGFPLLAGQLVFNLRAGMVSHLDDFMIRRQPLHLCLADQGRSVAPVLARILVREQGRPESDAQAELDRLFAELDERSRWQRGESASSSSSAGSPSAASPEARP